MTPEQQAYNELVQEYAKLRQDLRQILADNEIVSNPAVSDEWIVNSIRNLIEQLAVNLSYDTI